MPQLVATAIARFRSFWRIRFAKVQEINRRYRNPRIKTGGFVGFALLVLRLYLIFLLGLLAYKFWTLLYATP